MWKKLTHVERMDWLSICKSIKFFQQLPEPICKEILEVMTVERIQEGETGLYIRLYLYIYLSIC